MDQAPHEEQLEHTLLILSFGLKESRLFHVVAKQSMHVWVQHCKESVRIAGIRSQC